MGMFTWVTDDTKRSICNRSSEKKTFTVYMLDHKGNSWKEENYEGYGVFGGKDYYELLAEMNGLKTREEGIKLAFGIEAFRTPNLVENPEWKWINKHTVECPSQGFIYE